MNARSMLSVRRVAGPGLLALLVNAILIGVIPLMARQHLEAPRPFETLPFRVTAAPPEEEPVTPPRTLKQDPPPKPIVKPEIVKEEPPPPPPKLEPVMPEFEMETHPRLATPLKIKMPPTPLKEPVTTEDAPVTSAEFASASLTGVKTEFQLGEVDSQPRVSRMVRPVYPHAARRRGVSGRVMVKCLVTAEGRPTRISIVESEPGGVFDESVMEAIRKWRFSPGIYQGKAVATWIMAPFKFDLRG